MKAVNPYLYFAGNTEEAFTFYRSGTDTVESSAKALEPGNNVYISLEAESTEEAERLFEGLSAGGRTEMALQATEWAEKYGSCVDPFGIQWMVSYTGNVQFGG